METREEILNKVKQYIVNVLEPKRKEFSGFAACPFVKAERLKDRIMYDVLDGSKKFIDLVKEFDASNYTTAIFVQLFPDGESLTPKQGSQYQRFLNASMKENGLGKYKNICFNPSQNYNIDGFAARKQAPYFIINVAPRKDLAKAHDSLLNTDYFSNFPDDYKKFLKLKG